VHSTFTTFPAWRPVVYAVLASVLVGLSPAAAGAAETFVGEVVGVSDGDTMVLLTVDRQRVRVRLQGIDAPEDRQAFGKRAKQSLSDLAFRQRATALCPRLDRYQRQVCTVTVDGVDVGMQQILRGMAWHFVRYAPEQPAAQRAEYAQAESEARSARRGLWRDAAPVPPWEFRRAATH